MFQSLTKRTTFYSTSTTFYETPARLVNPRIHFYWRVLRHPEKADINYWFLSKCKNRMRSLNANELELRKETKKDHRQLRKPSKELMLPEAHPHSKKLGLIWAKNMG